MSKGKGTNDNDVEIARINAEMQMHNAELYAEAQSESAAAMAKMSETVATFNESFSSDIMQYFPTGTGGAPTAPCCSPA